MASQWHTIAALLGVWSAAYMLSYLAAWSISAIFLYLGRNWARVVLCCLIGVNVAAIVVRILIVVANGLAPSPVKEILHAQLDGALFLLLVLPATNVWLRGARELRRSERPPPPARGSAGPFSQSIFE